MNDSIKSEIVELTEPRFESRVRVVSSDGNDAFLEHEINTAIAEMEADGWQLQSTAFQSPDVWTTVMLTFQREAQS